MKGAHFQRLPSGFSYYNSLHSINQEINKDRFSVTKYIYLYYVFWVRRNTTDGPSVTSLTVGRTQVRGPSISWPLLGPSGSWVIVTS